jgi:riboflavin kinase/FMN adenylyltransferase
MQSDKSIGVDLKILDFRLPIFDFRFLSSKVANQKSKIKNQKSEIRNGVVLTFGVFDGVHVAHQIVINRVVNRARALGTDGVVVSFDSHPALAISGEAPFALTTTAKKIELLKMLGIDRVAVEDFDEHFSQLSPEEFVKSVLIDKFHAQELVVGYDCAFGKDKAGDKCLLKKLGKKYGFVVHVVEPYKLNGAVVSSTRIRAAISRGDLELAHKLLGRQYSLSGPVVPGKGIGREIGHATANLQLQKQVLPPPGVYAVKVIVGESRAEVRPLPYSGVLNMGVQPTFGGDEFRVEVHLLDFEGSLYGQNLEVFFVKNIRDEKVFASSSELADQIRKDEAVAREIFDAPT